MATVMAAVVDLPLEPVTPMTRAGQARRNRPISVSIRAGLPGDFEEAVSRPHRRIDHDQVRVLEVVVPMSAQMECGDGHVGQGRHRVGQRRRLGRIGHGDACALAGQPACRGSAAAEMAQAHDRHAAAVEIHRHIPSRPEALRNRKRRASRAAERVYFDDAGPRTAGRAIMPVWANINAPGRGEV